MKKKLPNNAWNTVTPLSRTLALIIVIVLPFLGMYVGMKYQRAVDAPLLMGVDENPQIQLYARRTIQPGMRTLPVQQSWNGRLMKCNPTVHTNQWACGTCYQYSIQDSSGKQLLFNDDRFSGLDRYVGDMITVIGQKSDSVSTTCPKGIAADTINIINE